MKRYFYLAFFGLLALTTSVRANDYLEHSEHYTVMNMGNGVYRFYIPIWVYGSWNDYFLNSTEVRTDAADSYQ